MWYIWLIAAGIFFVFEIATAGFLIFWLGIGSLIAMIFSFFIDNLFIQTFAFVSSSIILIFLTKPLINKIVKKDSSITTNSMVGKYGIVTIKIDSIQGVGQVKVNGEIWSAKCEERTCIDEGTEIEVLSVEGVKLVVSPIKVNSFIN